MKMKYFYLILFIILILNVRSPIPNWDISQQANTLNPMNYTIYDKTDNNINIRVVLNKKISRSGTQIVTQNYLLVYEPTSNFIGEREVNFEDIDSFHKNKIGYNILSYFNLNSLKSIYYSYYISNHYIISSI